MGVLNRRAVGGVMRKQKLWVERCRWQVGTGGVGHEAVRIRGEEGKWRGAKTCEKEPGQTVRVKDKGSGPLIKSLRFLQPSHSHSHSQMYLTAKPHFLRVSVRLVLSPKSSYLRYQVEAIGKDSITLVGLYYPKAVIRCAFFTLCSELVRHKGA